MGKEADGVEAVWPDGGRAIGRLQFEPPKLIFRGPERRVWQGEALVGVAADGQELVLADGARFRLPTKAASWADAIARPKGRLDKLGVKAGQRIAVVNLDDAEFVAELERSGLESNSPFPLFPAKAGTQAFLFAGNERDSGRKKSGSPLSRGRADIDSRPPRNALATAGPLTDAAFRLDLLFYGADSAAELEGIGTLVPRLAERGALWVVSLKGKAARVKDTEVMAAAKAHGLVDIKVCAFSDTRTALKFVRRRG